MPSLPWQHWHKMEVIKIPRFDFWHEEHAVFDVFGDFIYLADRLGHGRTRTGNGAAPIVVLKEMANIQKLPFEEIEILFTALRDAAFAYKPPEYKLLKEVYDPESLFTVRGLTKFDNARSNLKRCTKQHTELLVNLMDYQERCWKSRDKLKQYVSMLECAQMSLPYYVDDKRNYNARKHAVKVLNKDVTRRQMEHTRNVTNYQSALTEEQNFRMDMIKAASKLEDEITSQMKDSLLHAWTTLCRASQPSKFKIVLDPAFLSQSIYDLTCKTYTFITPASDVTSSEFNRKIQRPQIRDSDYYLSDFRYRTYGGGLYQSVTIREDIECVPENFLQLKKGDNMKLRLISSDMEIGFGYFKNSRFTTKKWGFVFSSSILYDETDSE